MSKLFVFFLSSLKLFALERKHECNREDKSDCCICHLVTEGQGDNCDINKVLQEKKQIFLFSIISIGTHTQRFILAKKDKDFKNGKRHD